MNSKLIYRAGQVPKYAKEGNTGTNIFPSYLEEDEALSTTSHVSKVIGEAKSLEKLSLRDKQNGHKRQTYQAEIVSQANESEEEEEPLAPLSISEKEDELTRRKREIAREKIKEKLSVPVIISTGDDDDSEEDEEAIARRRARAKARAKQREEEEEEVLPRELEEDEKEIPTVEEEEEEEEVSEYESEEEDDFPSRPRIAPVFKRKEERETVNEVMQMEKTEEMLEEERLKRLEERKQQSKELLKQEIERAKELDVPDEDPEEEEDDEGDGDEAEEYEKWKVRELGRIKRDREQKKALEQELAELERRRQLTDGEIMEEDKEKFAPKEKKQWNFLQKYYHKGAYYRTFDEKDEIANKWDFSQPTLEDKVDRTVLPEVLQVKNFGKMGRTKWTHLSKEDTTNWEAGWAQKDAIRARYKRHMGGTGEVGSAKRAKK